ncbi:MAG: hypothetical protein ACEQSE_12380 [Candidatus Aquirickettsiella gammari]
MAATIKKKSASPAKTSVVPAKSIVTKAKAAKVQVKPVAVSSTVAAAPKAPVQAKSGKSTAVKVASNNTVSTAAKKPVVAKKVPSVKKIATPVSPVSAEASVKEKHKKPKLVRDSFTMPEDEYAVLSEVKKACIAAGIEVKKSQLLRVGLQLLKKTPVSTLKTMIAGLQPLKAGRPKMN